MVNHSDGFEVGAALGFAVGSMVGLSDGFEVGAAHGFKEDSILVVGKSEGTIRVDGRNVGTYVGTGGSSMEGAIVGLNDGFWVSDCGGNLMVKEG